MASPMESAHKENEQQKSPMVVSSEEVLEQATNKHPGIILLGGKTVSESIDHQPSATQENSQTLSSTPNTNAPEPKKKLSPLRPLWTRLTTAIVEEGTDGSTIPESPRLPPQIPQVRFSGYFEQSIQSKGSLDSAWKQPAPYFIRLLSPNSGVDLPSNASILEPINIVFVNMVVAPPGEEDKTWIFEPSPEKDLVLHLDDEKTGDDKGNADSKSREPEPTSPVKQRRASTGLSDGRLNHPDSGSIRSRRSHESLNVQDPDPYVSAPGVHTSKMRSSLERMAAAMTSDGTTANSSTTGPPSKSTRRSNKKSTRTTKQAKETRSVNWLIDPTFLRKSIPEARVFQFGYRFIPTKPLTDDFYDVVANKLLNELTTGITQGIDGIMLNGPIIFVASGDAGFVVEKVVIACCTSQHPIFELISGVVFLATPFVGSKSFEKGLCRVIGRPVVKEEKEFFGRRSKAIDKLSIEFKKILETIGIPIWCFQTKNWLVHRSDVFETATTKLSSEYHEIGRFESAQDPDYLKVIDKLLEFTNARQLMDAAKENDLERIEALLEKKDGVSIDVDYQNVLGRTALHVSVRGNSDDVVAWLIKSGNANVRLADGDGFTALHFAVQNQSVKNVRLLLEAGADVNAQIFSSTPQKSPLDIARFLAKDKAAPDSKAKYKDDPIYWQLTHRPFLLDSSSYAVPRRVQGPRAPTSQDLIDACNQHTVAAIEFFKGKGPVRDSGNVFDMIYSSNPKSGPIEVLDSALGLALQNEREEKINLSGKKGKDMAVHHSAPESVCRWYHIPANNMVWVQDFLTKIGLDVPASSWMGEKHDGPTPHSRFLRPFAKTIQAYHDGKEKKILTFCMPFLDYESTSGRVKMTKHIRNKLEADKFGRVLQRLFAYFEARTRPSRYPPLPDSGSESDDRGNNSARSTTDAQTITTSNEYDEEHNIEFREAKKTIIKAYLTHKLPVHIRRTLDQYYYYMLPDTEHRDRDQVVFRHRKQSLYPEKQPDPDPDSDNDQSPKVRRKKLKQFKLLMVDQLWLWYIPKDEIFKSDIVLTCFPRRWCQNNPADADLLETMLKFEGRAPPVASIQSLIGLITSKCANIFDRSTAASDMQFMEYFESSIGKAADEETRLFDEFDRLSKKLNVPKKSLKHADKADILDKFLKIDDETKLLIEVKDIQDEIATIVLVLDDQQKVLSKVVTEMRGKFTSDETFDEEKFWDRHQMIFNNIRDFEKMAGQAKKTYDALNHLLELKTRQANAWEARFAREGGEETARQGTTILVFTVVTIIFLPLSFMASFMALNIKQFPKDPSQGSSGSTLWELSYASSLLFGISFAMSIPLVLLAFNVTAVQRFFAAHLLRALLSFIGRIFSFLGQKWKINISIRAWLPKLLSRLQYHGYLPDPLPWGIEKWKDRRQTEYDSWREGLTRGEEDEGARARRLEKEMMEDEEVVFGGKDSEEEEEEEDDEGGSDVERDGGDDNEDDGTTLAERSEKSEKSEREDKDKDKDEVRNGETNATLEVPEEEEYAKWDILGIRNRGNRLRKSLRGAGGDGGDEVKGDGNV